MDNKKLQSSFNTFLETRVAILTGTQKILIGIVIFLVPACLFYFLVFSPKNQEAAVLKGEVAQLKKDITAAKAHAAKLEEHQAELQEIEQKFKEASVFIPDTKEIPHLLTSISDQATESGLDINSFVPGGEADKEFYAELPFTIAVKGTYHNFGFFLDKVSKLPRIVNVSNLSLGSSTDVEGEMILSSNVNLVTYKFIEQSDNGGKKKKKKKGGKK